MVRERRAVELEVGPLSETEAGELLGDGFDRGRRQALYRESGGNPSYLTELARSAGAGTGELEAAAPARADDGVPVTVEAAIAAELDQLSARARTLASTAAVVGEPFDLELAKAVAHLDDAEGFAALDELLALDLARPAAVPGRFSFRHPIVRGAVYETAGESFRLEAHARLGRMLARRGAPLTAQAHHVERSARPGATSPPSRCSLRPVGAPPRVPHSRRRSGSVRR